MSEAIIEGAFDGNNIRISDRIGLGKKADKKKRESKQVSGRKNATKRKNNKKEEKEEGKKNKGKENPGVIIMISPSAPRGHKAHNTARKKRKKKSHLPSSHRTRFPLRFHLVPSMASSCQPKVRTNIPRLGCT